MTTQPLPWSNPKLNQGDCGCGCGEYGTLKKPWRDGTRCVARKCSCPRCRGKNNHQRGDSKARRARRGLRLGGPNTRHEEHWAGPVRTEAKSGEKGGANKVWTAYRNARAQSDAARPVGNTAPFVASFCPDNTTHVLYVIRDDDLEAAVVALAEVFGSPEIFSPK